MKSLNRWARSVWLYGKALGKWIILAAVVGTACGFIGTAFHVGVEWAAELRAEYPWLLFLLPAAGLLIVAIYKVTGTAGRGTNDVIDAVNVGESLPLLLVPAIFFGTVLTHLGGGSAGREGAALQMGGTIGYQVSRLFRLDDRDRRTAVLCGMAAFFSALFGTPMAATVFAIMVISVGTFYHSAFIPCFSAALIAYGISIWLGVAPTRFAVVIPEVMPDLLVRVAVLAALCAFISIVFCNVIHIAEHKMAHWFPNPWLRAVVGGTVIILLTVACGTSDYNGAGMNVIADAVERGMVHPEAFVLKMIFTAVTLSAGFKGGEVVPSFFVGSTFGCLVSPLLGLPAEFGAAVGLVSVFCGATNCPVASTFLALELFGGQGLLFFALACGISYMLSGYNGLYSSQRILYSKLKSRYINVHTNAHHEADEEENLPTVKGSLKES